MVGVNLILTAALCCNATINNNGSIPSFNTESNGNISNMYPTGTIHQIIDFTHTIKLGRAEKMKEWLNGKHLTVATLEDYPLSYIRKENGKEVGKGVSFEIVNFLAKKFNFTYDVVKPEKNIIGSTSEMEGSLLEILNKAELAAAFIPLLAQVRDHIAYSTTTLDEGEWIMVMLRPAESASGSGLLAPFDFWVWILIFLSLIVVGPIIYLLTFLRTRIKQDNKQMCYTMGHCAWFVYGALMKQGSTLSPIADSTRLLFATWWIFITILTSFYTANLTAFLTLSKFTLPFNSKEDILLRQKHFVSNSGNGVQYALTTPNESLYDLNVMINKKRAIFSELENDRDILADFVENKGYVFVRDRPAVDHMLYADYSSRRHQQNEDERMHCPFAVSKIPFMKKKRAFGYPLQSNLSSLLDPELLNLVESGIVKHLSSRHLPNAEICPINLGSTERQLRNGDLMMTYYIMTAGFTTSIVVFITEIVFRYINERKATTVDLELLKKFKYIKKDFLTNVTPPPPYTSVLNLKQNVFLKNNEKHGDKFQRELENYNYKWNNFRFTVPGNSNQILNNALIKDQSLDVTTYAYKN